MNTTVNGSTVEQLADKCADAYSTSRYRGNWAPCIRALRREGFNDREIEAILRSKWTRWAADQGGQRYGQARVKDLLEFVAAHRNEVPQLVAETFA